MRLLLVFVGLFLTFSGTAVFAGVNDCPEDDPVNGRAICFNPTPGPWGWGPCENAAPYVSNYAAWCRAGGGTYQGVYATPDCVGGSPVTEEEIRDRSVKFMTFLSGGSCSITNDTGWNASFPETNWCWGGTGEVYKSGYLIRDTRHINLACDAAHGYPGGSDNIYWYKSRTLVCPLGSVEVGAIRDGQSVSVCKIPVCLTCDTVGNPVTAASGYKTESQTDYSGAGGLEFTRYYHSYQFLDATTLTLDGHAPKSLGGAWRSNFDKRVVLVPAPGIMALSFPDGNVQYFNSQGKAIFNYTGGRASLVTLPNGAGYVYQGPDVVETYGPDGRLVSITRPTGETLTLAYGNTPDMFIPLKVPGLVDPLDFPQHFTLLRSVTDSYGRSLTFRYALPGVLVEMWDPSGALTRYQYDQVIDNLVSVTYPDGRSRRYGYAEAGSIPYGYDPYLPRALTTITDENGDQFGWFTYDTNGRVASSQHAGGALRYTFTRPSAATTNITDPLGTTRAFSFQVVDGITRLTGNSTSGGAGFGAGVQGRTYDSASNLTSQTDFNGSKTCYAYDTDRNLETARVEGLAAAANCNNLTAPGAALPAGSRKITTEWDPRWRVPARIAEPRRITTFTYNGNSASCAPAGAVIPDGSANGQPIGVLCSKAVLATTDSAGSLGFGATLEGQPRTSTYTYDTHGHVLTANGPRTDAADVTTTAYYADDDADPGKRGNVSTVTNALGHVTSITAYNAWGQPVTIVDPNGLTTNLAYDQRHRVVSRNVGGELTSYDRDGVGQLTKVTLPDGSFLGYSYDAAHRLTGMSDNLGNRIAYTLDAMGNRTQEQVFDPANSLVQTRSRVFNNLNQLFQEIGAANQTTQYAYDGRGNVTSVTDPSNQVTSNQYDSLNRLRQVTDPNNGVARYGYDGINQLVSVTDPRNLTTTYAYDGLSNLNSQVSPDTGTTSKTYDAAGNVLTQTDAKGQTTTYTYDPLDRVSSIAFADGSRQTYLYDVGTNGIGRLTSITETDPQSQTTGLIAYAYDAHGRTLSETRTIAGVTYTLGYTYDGTGRLSGMTYPSGRTIAYAFDARGRISQVNTTPPPSSGGPVVSNIAYYPFGGVQSYTLGNGQTYVRSYDQDGRIASYTLGAQTFALGYDAAGRITFITDTVNATNSNTYSYDNLDRLTGAVSNNVPFAYVYDAVGNRTSKTVGAATDTYAYGATSNQLTSITSPLGGSRAFGLDINGSTTSDGINQYAYDTRGRMVQSTGALGTTSYQVNALGQRIRKTNPLEDRIYLYDSRGRLIAETDPGGTTRREYLYLNDIPLAVIQ
jgi:YD repeat-containing protein